MGTTPDPEETREGLNVSPFPNLRNEAAARLADAPPPAALPRSANALLHELQVHQIELEMQNEALRQSQVALEESRDRYLDLYEFAPVGYLTLSRAGMIEQINLAGATLLGDERRKLLLRRFAHHIVAADHERWQRHFLHAVQRDDTSSCELALQRSSGRPCHVRLDCVRVAADGEAPVVRVALTDITARKLAEAELRIAAVAFDSQQGMVVTDAAGIILRVNSAFTRMTGYSPEEAAGKTPALLRSGRHGADFYRRMWQGLTQDRYWQGEIWNRRKNGKIFAEWLSITAVTDAADCVTHYVAAFSDITKNKEAEAEIHRLAYYDPLTELPNRRLLLDRLNQAFAVCARRDSHGALIFLDLDHFKTLNDTRGHEAGDRYLVEIARRLKANVRVEDTVARLGGDEFVILLEDLGEAAQDAAAQVQAVGEKIRAVVGEPCLLDDTEYSGTASIGIGLFRDRMGHADELLGHADVAMYQAKSAGRDTLRFFDPAMQAALEARVALATALRQALKRREFSLHYQPQFDGERRIFGAEALLRWEHAEHGRVSPAQFIPLAEETGLILPIGLWVLETACAQLKAWAADSRTRKLQLAVNVSARQFRQAEFVDQVGAALARSGADPGRLKLELTESLVLDDVEDTIEKMQALRLLGVGFSMDDFGTGYSSLSYLTRLPLDQLKIDQSFVRNLATNPNDAVIVQTIITMARSLGLNVIAEGVETEVQHEFLSRHGCHAYQGYLFGRPLPLDQFDRLMMERGS